MKIALFSDLHGNDCAFEAILADMDKQQVDLIVCAGDAVNPFPGSRAIWLEIQRRKIPMVIGNHEQYVLSMVDPADPWAVQGKLNFQPLTLVTNSLSTEIIAEMGKLPMSLSIPGPNGDDVLVCHGSPSHTRRSFSRIMDEAMVAELSQCPQRVIAAGHIHEVWSRHWQDKLLFLCGGAGLPLEGDTRAHYAILTYWHGQWHLTHRRVRYDLLAMQRKLQQSNFLRDAGPIAWLMYDELGTAQKRMVPFLSSLAPHQIPNTVADLQIEVRRFLESIDRWEHVAPFIPVEAFSAER